MQAHDQARERARGQRAAPDDDRPYEENGGDNEYDGEYDENEYDDEDGQITRSSAITAAGAAKAALEQIAQLTAKEPEGATAVEPADGSWIVGVEVVEDRRIPSSADILATYEATVDTDGDLVSYHRTKRYSRGRSDLGGGM